MKIFKLSKFSSLRILALPLIAVAFGEAASADNEPPLVKVTPNVIGTQNVAVVGCYFLDTALPGILDNANGGINKILERTHDYFHAVSNHKMNFQGTFLGWYRLPKTSDQYDSDGVAATNDCTAVSTAALSANGMQTTDYKAIVMLFNLDLGFASATTGEPGKLTWTHLRYTGGFGGGWTSEALWAHELGHAFGLRHSTYPVRMEKNAEGKLINHAYDDAQDAMSGFFSSAQTRWNFLTGGVCNGFNFFDSLVSFKAKCIYKESAPQVPVHYSAFQKQRLGWLDPGQFERHWGGDKEYLLSAPTPNDNDPANTIRFRKMVYVLTNDVPTPGAYYAIEYRRGDGGNTIAAERRGWDSAYEKGIRSDRVTVYLVEPDLHNKDPNDFGDANLEAVLKPGDYFDSLPGKPSLHVNFTGYFGGDASGVTARVFVSSPSGPLTPPITTFSANSNKGDTWFRSDVTATLAPIQTGPAIDQTYFGIDDPGCNASTHNCARYTGPFLITGDGIHDITYFSTDVTGQAEQAQHATIRIDKTPPATSTSVTTASGAMELTLVATDAVSGIREVDYAIDKDKTQDPGRPYLGPITLDVPGPHTVEISSIDKAGNREVPKTLAVNVPTLPFTATATATPSRITSADGGAVNVHVDLRTDSLGSTLRLTKVSKTGNGRVADWTLNTPDVDGVVYAINGAVYSLTYTLTDPSGRTTKAKAKVVVGQS